MPQNIKYSVSIGQTYGAWFVVSINSRGTVAKCECKCGDISFQPADRLILGLSKQCKQCRNREQTTHGMDSTEEYVVWTTVKAKARNDADTIICEDWNSFEQFFKDMGKRPKGCYLARRDRKGIYCKENCYWEKRSNRGREHKNLIQIDTGTEILTIKEVAARTGMQERTIRNRLKAGWPDTLAIDPNATFKRPGDKRRPALKPNKTDSLV